MLFKKITQSQIKHLRSLQLKKYRQKYNQFVVEGRKSVLEFLDSSHPCLGVFGSESELEGLHLENIESIGCVANSKQMNQISALKQSAGLLACFEMPKEQALNKNANLILALDDIRDPGNLGTIIRSADWFGLNQILCSEESVDCFNPKVVQSSMGSLSRVEVHYVNLHEVLKELSEHQVFVADMLGKDYTQVSFDKAILVIGNEGHGVSDKILSLASSKVTIPRKGKAESLNAAISASVLLANWSLK